MKLEKLHQALILTLVTSVVIAGCSKKDSVEENSNELITTVEVKLTERGTSNELSFEFEDIDGPGGQAPEIDVINLAPNKIYDATVEIYDKSKNPAVEIDEEVEEEGDVHRLYYTTAAAASLTISDLDNDANGKPLGLHSVWTTGEASNGNVTITLRHYENGGKETSDPVNSSKSNTDALVEFPVIIQ